MKNAQIHTRDLRLAYALEAVVDAANLVAKAEKLSVFIL